MFVFSRMVQMALYVENNGEKEIKSAAVGGTGGS